MYSIKHELSANFAPEGDRAAPPRDMSNMSLEQRDPLCPVSGAAPEPRDNDASRASLANVYSDVSDGDSDSGYELHYYNSEPDSQIVTLRTATRTRG